MEARGGAPTPQSRLPKWSKDSESLRRPMSSTTITDLGSRCSMAATRYSQARTSSMAEPRENLCWSTPHWEGKGRGARNVVRRLSDHSIAVRHARCAPIPPTADPKPKPTGPPIAQPSAPPSAPPPEATPSWVSSYSSSPHASNAELPISSAKNDLPEPLGPVKCNVQSAHVARGALPVYDSRARLT